MNQGRWVAPGRVNLIGEHTDYNNGYVLPIALPQVVSCEGVRRDDGAVRVASRQHRAEWLSTWIDGLADADISGWARYPLGVVYEFHRRGHPIGGVDLMLDGAVPVGAGLSSSAAVECAVAVALRDLFALEVSDEELVDIARAAENDYVGAPTGILDQSASMLCTAGHALFLDVATRERAQIPFDLHSARLELLVVDTNTPHAHVDGEYALRRRQCEQAAQELGVDSLRAVTEPAKLDGLTDPVLHKRARHVVSENIRVLEVVRTLADGDPRTIGPLLSAGHASLRDDFEVSVPQLDIAVTTALEAGAYGARMVGGGFGGSIIALVDVGSSERVGAAIADRFAAEGFSTPRAFTAVPSAGARRITGQENDS